MATQSIDYTSRDYEGLRSSMLAYANLVIPEWTSRSPGDLGMVMVELMAYVGDIMSYYVDRTQDEAYLSTATLDSSVVTIANMLGYVPQTGVAATGTVALTLTGTSRVDTIVPRGTRLAAVAADSAAVYFETTTNVVLTNTAPRAAVPVREGTTVARRLLGQISGVKGQFFVLDDLPIVTDSIRVEVDYDDGVVEAWSRVDFLAQAGPADKVYKIALDRAGTLRMTFGDGVNGALPGVGLGVYVTYIRGGGVRGNLAANTEMILTLPIGNPTGGFVEVAKSTANPALSDSSVMRGGLDADSREDIRRNVPTALRTRNRAVTLSDYVDLALRDPAIVKAAAVAQHPGAISVYVLTNDDRASDNTATRSRVQRDLQTKVPAGVIVALYPVVVLPFTIGNPASPLAITAYDTYDNLAVSQAVNKALLARYALANATLGGPITASDIYRTVLGVAGVRVCAPPTWKVAAGAFVLTDTTFQPWQIAVLTTTNLAVTGGIA